MSEPLLTDLLRTGFEQLDRWDVDGLERSIAALQAFDAGDGGSPAAQVHAHAISAHLAVLRNDGTLAVAHAQAGRIAAQGLDDARALAALGIATARALRFNSDTGKSFGELEAAWPLALQSADPWLQSTCATMLAGAWLGLRQGDTATQWAERAAHIGRQAGMWACELNALLVSMSIHMVAGNAFLDVGDREQGHQAFEAAFATHAGARHLLDHPDTPGYIRIYSLARVHSMQSSMGRWDEALRGMDACEQMLLLHPDADLAHELRMWRLDILVDMGDVPAAVQLCQRALAEIDAGASQRSHEEMLHIAADLAEQMGEHGQALQHLKRLLALREALALDAAKTHAAAAAVRLQTEHSLAEAAAERARAAAIDEANEGLRSRGDQFAQQASCDALTGLANRRRFDARLAEMHADAVARDVPLCLAMLDADHFKRVNDVHGHGVGDAVLRRLAVLMQSQCRDDDLLARLGGEEFSLLFSGVGMVQARTVCERIRQAVESEPWGALSPGLSLTLSIGLCDASRLPTPAAALGCADAYLYEAKHGGRNRVVASPALPAHAGPAMASLARR